MALKLLEEMLPHTFAVDDDVEMDGSRCCLPFSKGFEWEGWIFVYSKSHQPLVSTGSSGLMTWGTTSAVLLLSTVCMHPLIFLAALLHDHQSCYCGTQAAICPPQ